MIPWDRKLFLEFEFMFVQMLASIDWNEKRNSTFLYVFDWPLSGFVCGFQIDH